MQQVAAFLKSTTADNPHIFFVHGFTNEWIELEETCCALMKKDEKNRPVVMIASMADARSFSDDEMRLLRYRRLFKYHSIIMVS